MYSIVMYLFYTFNYILNNISIIVRLCVLATTIMFYSDDKYDVYPRRPRVFQ